MFQFDRDNRDIISFHQLFMRSVLKAVLTRSTVYSNCAAIRGVLDYCSTVFKCVYSAVHLVDWLKASLTNQAVMKWGQRASAHITRANDNELMQNLVIQSQTCLHKHTRLSALFCMTVCYVAEDILPLLFWPDVGRWVCESWCAVAGRSREQHSVK